MEDADGNGNGANGVGKEEKWEHHDQSGQGYTEDEDKWVDKFRTKMKKMMSSKEYPVDNSDEAIDYRLRNLYRMHRDIKPENIRLGLSMLPHDYEDSSRSRLGTMSGWHA